MKRIQLKMVFCAEGFTQGNDLHSPPFRGFRKDWHLKQEKLSPRYTTRWDELLKVKAG